MGLRGVVLLGLFLVTMLATPLSPVAGVLAYLAHYYLWPENQWWGEILASAGIRVSFSVTAIAVGAFALHWRAISRATPPPLFHSQELLYLAFLLALSVASLSGASPYLPPELESHVIEKLFKLGVFLFILTHVGTTPSKLSSIVWFMYSVGGVYLGLVAREAPSSSYSDGRLNAIGGPDFQSTNYLAAHFAAMGVLGIGAIVTSTSWPVRLSALAGGGLIANAFILCRTRGAFLAIIIAAVSSIFLASRRVRTRVLCLLPFALILLLLITDAEYFERIGSISATEGERDESAQARVEIWRGGLAMFAQHPLGVGPGNFGALIGQFAPDHPWRDAHSTYVRVLAELGIAGTLVFGLLHLNGFRTLARTRRLAEAHGLTDWCYLVLAAQLCLVIYAVCGLTGTFLYTEALYMFLMLPVCLERALSNHLGTLLVGINTEIDQSALAEGATRNS